MSDEFTVPLAGVALFDDTIGRTSGHACLAHDTPRVITSPSELSSAAVWMLNIDSTMFRSSGLAASNRFRMQDYLRSNCASIATEIGVSQRIDNARRAVGPAAAQTLAALFGNVMEVAWRLGVGLFPPHQLRVGFRQAHYPEAFNQAVPDDIAHCLADACQNYTMSERRRQARSELYEERPVSFIRHRYLHAMEVIRQMVPFGQWRVAPRMSPNEILTHHQPLLLEVEIQSIANPLGAIINFGGPNPRQVLTPGGRQMDASPRRWITHPEYMFLQPHAQISVLKILEAEAYQDNPLLARFPEFGPLQMMSQAFQLAFESFWTCPYRAESGKTDRSAVAAWMGAYDRIACLNDALNLIKRDPEIDVVSLGYGRITTSIVYPGANYGQWLAAMVQGTRLIPPLVTEAPGTMVPTDDQDPVQLLQAIQIAGYSDALLENDSVALRDFDAQIADLRAAGN